MCWFKTYQAMKYLLRCKENGGCSSAGDFYRFYLNFKRHHGTLLYCDYVIVSHGDDLCCSRFPCMYDVDVVKTIVLLCNKIQFSKMFFFLTKIILTVSTKLPLHS